MDKEGQTIFSKWRWTAYDRGAIWKSWDSVRRKFPEKAGIFFVQSLSMRTKIVDKTFSIWIMASTTTHTPNRPTTEGPITGAELPEARNTPGIVPRPIGRAFQEAKGCVEGKTKRQAPQVGRRDKRSSRIGRCAPIASGSWVSPQTDHDFQSLSEGSERDGKA